MKVQRKRRQQDEDKSDRWVVSYADFITLLFAFFTVMYAISHVDLHKLEMFSGSMKTAFKSEEQKKQWSVIDGIAPISPEIADIERALKNTVQNIVFNEGIKVDRDKRGVVVSLQEKVLFDIGSAEVKASALNALSTIASALSELPNYIAVEGHTDDVPINTELYPSNWELSSARSSNVLKSLLAAARLSPSRFTLAGYAQYRPIASNDTIEGRAKNRRVDIVVLSGTGGRQVQ